MPPPFWVCDPPFRAAPHLTLSEPPSPDPGGVTPMADRAAAYGHYGKSGSNFFGSQHFGTASSFHHDGSLHEATPLPPDDFRGQTATTQGLTTGGGGSTRFGAETGGGLHTMASARSMANTAPATGATAGAADGVWTATCLEVARDYRRSLSILVTAVAHITNRPAAVDQSAAVSD